MDKEMDSAPPKTRGPNFHLPLLIEVLQMLDLELFIYYECIQMRMTSAAY